jgi:hypothetical protein
MICVSRISARAHGGKEGRSESAAHSFPSHLYLSAPATSPWTGSSVHQLSIEQQIAHDAQRQLEVHARIVHLGGEIAGPAPAHDV